MFLMCSMIVENGHGQVSPSWSQYVYWAGGSTSVVSENVRFETFNHGRGGTNWCGFDGHVETLPYTTIGMNRLGGALNSQTLATWTSGGIIFEKY